VATVIPFPELSLEDEWDEVFWKPIMEECRAERLAARARGEAWAQLEPALLFPAVPQQLRLPFHRITYHLPDS
jgi:hypothetical protein